MLLFNDRDRYSLAKLVADARFLSLLLVCCRYLRPTTLQPILAVADAGTRCQSSWPIFAADTLRPRSKIIHAVHALQPLSQPEILAADILRPCLAPRFATHTAHCPRLTEADTHCRFSLPTLATHNCCARLLSRLAIHDPCQYSHLLLAFGDRFPACRRYSLSWLNPSLLPTPLAHTAALFMPTPNNAHVAMPVATQFSLPLQPTLAATLIQSQAAQRPYPVLKLASPRSHCSMPTPLLNSCSNKRKDCLMPLPTLTTHAC